MLRPRSSGYSPHPCSRRSDPALVGTTMFIAAYGESTCEGRYEFGPRVCPCGQPASWSSTPSMTSSQARTRSHTQTRSQSQTASATLTPSSPRTMRSLAWCQPGTWCGLGRAIIEGPALTCPPGAACSSPALLEPVTCNLGGNCSAASCPQIPYCPAGSTQEELCPAGKSGSLSAKLSVGECAPARLTALSSSPRRIILHQHDRGAPMLARQLLPCGQPAVAALSRKGVLPQRE